MISTLPRMEIFTSAGTMAGIAGKRVTNGISSHRRKARRNVDKLRRRRARNRRQVEAQLVPLLAPMLPVEDRKRAATACRMPAARRTRRKWRLSNASITSAHSDRCERRTRAGLTAAAEAGGCEVVVGAGEL